MMPRFEPALEFESGCVGRIWAREAARGKADPARLRPYCFLKALAPMHGPALTPRAVVFVGISVLRPVSPSALSDTLAVEAVDLVKDFGDTRAVDGVNL